MQKNVLAINDISCTGRCSLTITLPIVSSAKLECTILPTAILSTHVGFKNFTFCDFTEEMKKIANHFVEIGKKFDAIYTGFIGTKEQVLDIINIVNKFKTDSNILVVDPAMADNGLLYPTFDETFPSEMLKLCKISDIVIPNVTEACLMTNTEYRQKHSEEYIDDLLDKLVKLGMKKIILTGVNRNFGKVGAVCYDSINNVKSYYEKDLIEGYFHGTGDIFASVVVSSITRGVSLDKSMKIAVDVTVDAIKQTIKYKDIDIMFGVCFEEALPLFMNELEAAIDE